MVDDRSLITAARDGDQRAYAALYSRHHRRALHEARKVVRNMSDAEDSVAAAFASTFLAIRKGVGPDQSFRAYLLTAVRNAALQLVRTKRYASEVVSEDPQPTVVHIDTYAIGADPAVREAFQNLPSRWQEVLWKTEIEGTPPRILSEQMAMSATSVAALAKRARDGFRKAYLTSAIGSDPHAWASERIDLLREGALDPRSRDLVELHVESCATCQGVLVPVAAQLSPASIGIVLLAGGAVPPIAGMGGGVVAGAGLLGRLRPRGRTAGRMSAKVATASTAAVAIVGMLLVVVISARSGSSSDRSAATTTTIGVDSATAVPATVPLPAATPPPVTDALVGDQSAPLPDVSAAPTTEGATTTAAVVDATGTTATPTTAARPIVTTRPATPAAVTTTSAFSAVGPPSPTVSTAPPAADVTTTTLGTLPPTPTTTVLPPTDPPPSTADTTVPTTTTTIPETTTTIASPPNYDGEMMLSGGGTSGGVVTLNPTGADGLPAGTTMRFTFWSTDPNWTVRFVSTSHCVGLPAELPGDALSSLAVVCTTPAFAQPDLAVVKFEVDDPTCLDHLGVTLVVVGQRPFAAVASLTAQFGC